MNNNQFSSMNTFQTTGNNIPSNLIQTNIEFSDQSTNTNPSTIPSVNCPLEISTMFSATISCDDKTLISSENNTFVPDSVEKLLKEEDDVDDDCNSSKSVNSISSTINMGRANWEMLNDPSTTSTERMKAANELVSKLNYYLNKHKFVEENKQQNDIGGNDALYFMEC